MTRGRRRAGCRLEGLRTAAACAAAAAIVSCAPETSPPPPGSSAGATAAPVRADASLLLVTLDTFRADAAGCGGNPVARTRHLDRLARQGRQFETGLAATPLTAPSHASILTGLDPPAHGVRDNGAFRLGPEVPNVAAALASHGLGTAAFVTAFPLDARFGFDRGFATFDDVDTSRPAGFVMVQRPGVEAVAAARAWWGQQAAGAARWFVWIHLFDAHTPHDAPRPLLNASARDPYLADVAVADAALGAAVDAARDTGRPFWTVVLADHGEGRGDHGEATHGLFVYASTIRIPAVIWPAPGTPGPAAEVFRQIDFPATAFDLLGLDPEDAPGAGHSALEGGERVAYAETFYPRFHYGWSELTAVQDGDWKYIEAPEPELYDLEADPGEVANAAVDHPGIAASLADTLGVMAGAAAAAAPEPEALDPAAREALAALGYLAGGEAKRDDAPDPKRMVAIEALMARTQALLSAGQLDAAAVPLRQALARDPRNKELYQMLGHLNVAAGQDANAVDAYRKALDLPPHHADRVPRFELACAFLRLGKPGEAVPELQKILEVDPEDPPTWYNLGVAWEGLGQVDRAREAWQRALALDPGHEFSRAALGRTGGRAGAGAGVGG